MKFSCVFFCVFAFVSCIFVSPFKKTSSRFLFCSAFPASNSVQILVGSYLSSELRWQVFSLRWTWSHRSDAFGPTESSRYNRTIQLGVTDFTTGKTSCHLPLHSFWSSSTQWILSSTSIPFNLLLCSVTQGPNPLVTKKSRRTLLGNWCQRGREYSNWRRKSNHQGP